MTNRVVFTFGRFSPPTIGHEKLFNVIHETANELDADAFVYVSRSENRKTNLLSFRQKIEFFKNALDKNIFKLIQRKSLAQDPFQASIELIENGYTDLYFVVGSDRFEEFDSKLKTWINREYKNVNFTVLSAGKRNPRSKDIIISSSVNKALKYVIENNFEDFSKIVLSGLNKKQSRDLFKILKNQIKN